MRVFLAGLLLFCAGCGCPSAVAWKSAWGDVRQPYLNYVEADASLSPTDKEVRRQHVALMDAVLKGVK